MNKNDMNDNIQENSTERPKWQRWLKRIGIAGFLFFLIKGLIWLAVFYFFGKSVFGG